jgi:hypothetical protein
MYVIKNKSTFSFHHRVRTTTFLFCSPTNSEFLIVFCNCLNVAFMSRLRSKQVGNSIDANLTVG